MFCEVVAMKIVPAPVKKGLKWFFKPAVSVKSWVSWDMVKDNTQYVKDSWDNIRQVPKAARVETFEQAIARLNLTEADLKERQGNFLRLALILIAFTLITLLYTLYLLWSGEFGSGALAFVVSLISAVTAARYHFWYFQVKNRKLGCTIREWLDAKVQGDK
jgi:intracellular multiplication protein IcmV